MKNKLLLTLSLMFVLVISVILSACDGQKQIINISVFSSNINDGMVWGQGQFYQDDKITLTAQASQNAEFVAWIKNNKHVSSDAVYQFNANSKTAGAYTAVFKGQNPTYYTPFAIAFSAQEKISQESEIQPVITLNQINFNFASSNFSSINLINQQKDIDFLLQSALQSSMIYEFNPEVFLKVYSGYDDKQSYTFSFDISYTINETNINSKASLSIAITEMQDEVDSYDAPYKYISLTFSDKNINFYGYAWFAPAGIEIDTSNLSNAIK